jgi:hypothetical protein
MEESLHDGLAEAGNGNGLPGLASLFQDTEALGFALGDGDLFHGSLKPWSMTMVNLRMRAESTIPTHARFTLGGYD